MKFFNTEFTEIPATKVDEAILSVMEIRDPRVFTFFKAERSVDLYDGI